MLTHTYIHNISSGYRVDFLSNSRWWCVCARNQWLWANFIQQPFCSLHWHQIGGFQLVSAIKQSIKDEWASKSYYYLSHCLHTHKEVLVLFKFSRFLSNLKGFLFTYRGFCSSERGTTNCPSMKITRWHSYCLGTISHPTQSEDL